MVVVNPDKRGGHAVCFDCPLIGYAWSGEFGGEDFFCESGKESLFEIWKSCPVEENSYWASRMVWACNKAIEDILIGELK